MTGPTQAGDTISVMSVIEILLRRRKLLFGFPIMAATLVVAWALVETRTYTAWMEFTPDAGQSQLSSLAGVAADFGVNLPGSDNTQSPQFYTDLMSSQTFLEHLADAPYRVTVGGTVQLARLDTLFGVSDRDSEVIRIKTALILGQRLNTSVSSASGIVRVSLSLISPDLAKAVIDRTLAQIQEFDTKTRQSRARYERRFIEGQVAAASADLRVAEDSVSDFLIRNRDFRNSPRLQFESDRLQRAVTLQQGILVALLQSLQQAKIDEVKAEPALTMVEPPTVSAVPDRRRLALKLVITLFACGTLAVGMGVAEAYYLAAAKEDEALAKKVGNEAMSLWQLLTGWVHRAWAGVRRGTRQIS